MIKSTVELIEYLKVDREKRQTTLIQCYVKSILKVGSKEDATSLLDIYLKNPFDYHYGYLLPLFKKFGDIEFAEKIFNSVLVGNELRKDIDPEVLNLLGNLKYEPIKRILINYGLSEKNDDYHLHKASILGLLNFSCVEHVDKITDAINKCLNKSLFAEFIPALVCKLPNRQNIIEQLYELGDTVASTDCNAGIILGFSLCGDEGKRLFKSAIFNPNWECFSFGTGTVGYAYEGMKNLNISFSELYSEIKRLKEKDKIEYSLEVLFSFFYMRVIDDEDEKIESFKTLYFLFFSWENPNFSNNLIDLARQVGMEEKAYEYERIFELKMTEEIVIKNYSN